MIEHAMPFSSLYCLLLTLLLLLAPVKAIAQTTIVSTDGKGHTQVVSGDCVRGNGIQKTETYPLKPSDHYLISVPGHIEVQQAAETSIAISADSNLLKLFKIQQESGMTLVTVQGRFTQASPIQVKLGTPSLTHLELSGNSHGILKEIKGDSLKVILSGTGDILLTGAVKTLELSLAGAGEIDARGMSAKTARVKLSGAGNISLTAGQAVEADLSGAGNIDVYGNPKNRTENIRGAGAVNYHDRIE